MQGEILEGLVARIVSQESSKHMEKVLEEFPPPPAEGGTRICFVMSFIFGLVNLARKFCGSSFIFHSYALPASYTFFFFIRSYCLRDNLIHLVIYLFISLFVYFSKLRWHLPLKC